MIKERFVSMGPRVLKAEQHILILALFFNAFVATFAYAEDYKIAPIPGWVKTVLPITGIDGNSGNEVAYLLVDHQWKISDKKKQHFQHFTDKALNISGTEQISHFSIEFDPIYEFVTLHTIKVERDGRIIDKIDSSRINILQREEELESQIYDGTKSLNVLIDDVRVGDIVSYSYTISGSNPVLNNHFSNVLAMGWSVPLGRYYYRVLWPNTHPLLIKNFLTSIKPEKSILKESSEYIWTGDNISEIIEDSATPDWYSPYPRIYLSDFSSWKEVALWALPFYEPETTSPAVRDLVASILQRSTTKEKQILAALHFVQNEVRYLGLEMGVRSHRPGSPEAILKQRYGDCKDKSRLLLSILTAMNIKAKAALVNSYNGRKLLQVLPTPKAFNHAIVMIQLDGKTYWLDPTRNHQKGNLKTLYQRNYEYALVLTDKTSKLTCMADDIKGPHTKTVEETFDISGGADHYTNYWVTTSMERYYADSMRQELAATSRNEIQQSYLNYIASNYYPGVQTAEPLSIKDDASRNRLTIREKYVIPKIWSTSDDERHLYFTLEPFLIRDHIKNVSAPVRTMPYAVTHPVLYKQTTRVHTPPDSTFENESFELTNEAFKFSRNVTFADNILVIDYSYESLKDHVLPADIKTYAKDISTVLDQTFYPIKIPNPEIDLGTYHFDSSDINWWIVVLLIFSFIVALFIGIKFIYLYDPQYWPEAPIDINLQGLSGWLIVLGFILIATPIRLLIESKSYWYIFSAKQCSIIKEELGQMMMKVVAAEMICNVFLFVIALVLIVMFFKRRHTFPHFFKAYLFFALFVSVADIVVLKLLSLPVGEIMSNEIALAFRQAIFLCIWFSYFTKSKRVKATFTKGRFPQNQTYN